MNNSQRPKVRKSINTLLPTYCTILEDFIIIAMLNQIPLVVRLRGTGLMQKPKLSAGGYDARQLQYEKDKKNIEIAHSYSVLHAQTVFSFRKHRDMIQEVHFTNSLRLFSVILNPCD